MNQVYLLLGSNLTDREDCLSRARVNIAKDIGDIVKSSAIYESEPWGFETDSNFLNQVLLVETMLDPSQLLASILKIEKYLGRKRNGQNGYESRNIDIDILFYNHDIIDVPGLQIPHPRIQERLFTLIPVGEIDETFVHPLLQQTIQQLVLDCPDNGIVKRYAEDTKVNQKK